MNRRRVLTAALLAASAGAAAVAVGVPAGVVVEILLVVLVAAVASRLLLGGSVRTDPFERALAVDDSRLGDPIAVLGRRVESALFSAADTHRILRPMLADLADERLRRRAISMADPAAASTALGDDLWDLVRPDRGRPPPDQAPWTREDLRAALDRLADL